MLRVASLSIKNVFKESPNFFYPIAFLIMLIGWNGILDNLQRGLLLLISKQVRFNNYELKSFSISRLLCKCQQHTLFLPMCCHWVFNHSCSCACTHKMVTCNWVPPVAYKHDAMAIYRRQHCINESLSTEDSIALMNRCLLKTALY